MRIRRVLLLLALGLLVGACVVDNYWVDEITVVLEPPINEAHITMPAVQEGNIGFLDCKVDENVVVAMHGAAEFPLEIISESEDQRSQALLAAWDDSDEDGYPDCDEYGVMFHLDLDVFDTVTLPSDTYTLTEGGAVADCP